jgi:hypothetical protein
MIAFGGSDGTTNFSDIWVLTNANAQGGTPAWIALPTGTATVPEGQEGHTAVYDPVSDTMTIFGGIGLPAETWTAANASGLTQPPVWKLANAGNGIDARTWESAVLDISSLSMTVFGGLTNELVNSAIVLSPVL